MKEIYFAYFIENGKYAALIDAGTDTEVLMNSAKVFLQAKYGKTDTWGYETGRQLVHPNSPTPVSAGQDVDVWITTKPDLHR